MRVAGMLVGALLSLSALSGCDMRAKGTAATPRMPTIGATAPDYTAIDLDGKPVALKSLRDKVVVLNVWATWCLPCREEIPQLEALHQQYAGQGVEVIGVSIDAAGMGAEVADFMKAHDMTYRVWLDPDHDFSLKFLTVGVPETFVVDRAGTVRGRMIGALRPGDTTLVAAIHKALQ